MSYLARFEQLAAELAADPKVRLLGYHTFPAVKEEEIVKIEQRLGYQLDKSIRNFYLKSNGLQLRWVFLHNKDFQKQPIEAAKNSEAWDYASKAYRVEDGVIFLLPIEQVFAERPAETSFLDLWEEIDFLGKRIDLNDFYTNIYPFDEYSAYCNMAFYLDGTGNPPVLMGDEQRSNFSDSRLSDFASYLEFLIATKGLCRKRKSFYGQYQGHKEPRLQTDEAYWQASKERVSIAELIFEEEFPMAGKPGSATASIMTKKMQAHALGSMPVGKEELETAAKEHAEFLASGGAGGRWETFVARGIIFGTYKGGQNSRGKQACFDMRHFPPELDMQELQLPYSSWCAAWLKYQDFSEADLEGSLMTDTMLEKSIFADANLKGVDFSRANLRGASFMNANLCGADFENCDLTDADFRGANLEGARFPGAILKGVKR